MPLSQDVYREILELGKLLFTETLPVRKENFYFDRATGDQPPDNLLLNEYGTGDTSLLGQKPRGQKKFSKH